ncbi:MAG TPA: hypothetical protein VK249_25950 [Anaerolineales bacterium]|nr:hypothetical protein [Anaerolineales bacterium]
MRIIGSKGFIESINLNDANGAFVNAGSGSGPTVDPALRQIELDTEAPLPGDHFKGQLEFSVSTSPVDTEGMVPFRFDLDIPIHPALTFNPKQTVWANGLELLLDRVIITPAFTQAYVCYLKPSEADWVIGSDTTLRVNGQVANMGTYAFLFDSAYGDGSKGGEPGWKPPVDHGRCVKIGFPVGDPHPNSLVLTIPALEQSMPEVIPAADLPRAYEVLKAEGIDMEWHSVDHGAYAEYKKLPAGMSEQEAFHHFIQALGYIHPGGWTFNVQLQEASRPAQPVFSTSSFGGATPVPFPSEPSGIATIEARLHSFDLSPDGKTIAFATSRGIVLSNLDDDQTRTLNNTENFYSVAWSPDGNQLAAGSLIMRAAESGSPHLIVWDAASWKAAFELKRDQEDSVSFSALAWSPDGKRLALSFADRGLIVVDIETGKTVAQQQDFLLPPTSLSWSPDGSRLIATGDLGFGFRRWRLDTNQSIRLYDPRAGSAAVQLAWAPDGTRIASGHAGGTVCFWNVSTNRCDGFIHAHQNVVASLAWSPDGSKLATGGGVIRIWDSQTGQLLTAFGLNDKSLYTELMWTKSNLLVSLETGYGGDTATIVRFWDLATGKILKQFKGQSGSFGN